MNISLASEITLIVDSEYGSLTGKPRAEYQPISKLIKQKFKSLAYK